MNYRLLALAALLFFGEMEVQAGSKTGVGVGAGLFGFGLGLAAGSSKKNKRSVVYVDPYYEPYEVEYVYYSPYRRSHHRRNRGWSFWW